MIGDAPEHADLGLDVSPLAGCTELISERVVQLLAHTDDATRHALDFMLPARTTNSR